jgi:hypothetical protein
MRGLLPSVWLLLATLYTTSILALVSPFSAIDDWATPLPTNETERAKEPGPVASREAEPFTLSLQLVSLAAPVAPKPQRHDEWVQIAGYTTVVRAEPTTASPVLLAYSVGRPLRVIAREAGFARVQDLGSGQYGWVKETSLAPFTGGYRQPENVTPASQLVATAAPEPEAAQVSASVPEAAQVAAPVPQAMMVAKPVVIAAKKSQPARNNAAAVRAKTEMVAAAGPGQRGLFGMRRERPQRVALRGGNSGFAGMIGRAFGGR